MRIGKIVTVLLTIATLTACNDNKRTAGTGNAVKISASQIIFKSSGVALASTTGVEVDPNIKVLAQNVSIDTGSNALKSDNLQDALDKELAVDLGKTLLGKTWKVTNKTADPTYTGTTGQIKFNEDGTINLMSGYFAAIGKVHSSEISFCHIPIIINYEIISDGVMYVSAQVKQRDVNSLPILPGYKSRAADSTYTTDEDSVVKVVSRTTDKIVVTGSGGCGSVGSERISILTPQ